MLRSILKYMSLFIFAIVLSGCSKDETPAPKPETEEQPKPDPKPEEPEELEEPKSEIYFTLDVDSSKDTSKTDDWIIIHTGEGKLLDYKSYESGERLIFEKLKDSLSSDLIVTHFKFLSFIDEVDGSQSKQDYYDLRSYSQIPNKSSWKFGSLFSTDRTKDPIIGKFTLNIEAVNDPVFYDISNRNGFISNSHSQSINPIIPEKVDIHYEDFPLDANGSYFYTHYNRFGENRYAFIKDIKDEDELILQSQDLRDFDSYLNLDITFNNFDIRVNGYQNMDEYRTSSGYMLNFLHNIAQDDFENLNPVKIGYLDSFSIFRTSVNIYNPTYYYYFHQLGAKTEEIILPEFEPYVDVLDESINSFDFITNVEYFRKFSVWSNQIPNKNDSGFRDIIWAITSEKSSIPALNLPTEILEKYPDLTVEDLPYHHTAFYTDKTKYENFIDRRFISPDIFHPFVEESIRFLNE